MDLTNVNTSKKEEMARANFSPMGPIAAIPIVEEAIQQPPAIFNDARLLAPHSMPVAPPGWNQLTGPNYWGPQFISTSNPNPIPNYTLTPVYDPQIMPQWGGQPTWDPVLGPPAQPLLQHPHPPMHWFHAPTKAAEPAMPVQPPFHPPSHSIDSHPIPPGDPPYAFRFPAVPFDERFIDHSVSTPTKKVHPQTPKKTPAKRKRQEVEDTPSKKPTRASNRTRTPKKIFEIGQ
jgi:hypothetical protein